MRISAIDYSEWERLLNLIKKSVGKGFKKLKSYAFLRRKLPVLLYREGKNPALLKHSIL